jgi:hypothetical protein
MPVASGDEILRFAQDDSYLGLWSLGRGIDVT